MAVTNVRLSAQAYMVCLTHALSTEKEEIMGLLIGEVTSYIIALKPTATTQVLYIDYIP